MKKLLALVLALVMTLGLATVGANAAYADADDIEYKEAVDVMTAIGVLAGDETGFRPADTLKRSEGAKIVAYLMLGNTTAEAIQGTGAKFTDVPANHWAAGYIEYLTSAGVIGGVGGGKFDPDGQLTATAFAKMLLVALGYDAEIEGFGGSDWAINVQKVANQNELFDGNKNVVGSAAVTREEAALYAFNALCAPLVEYSTKGTAISVGSDATVTIGASSAKPKTNTGLPNQTIYNDIINDGQFGTFIVEFAEEYYPKLRLRGNGDTDDFGRPADIWTYDGKSIGTYAATEDELYTETVKLGKIYSDLGLTKTTTATRYLNGKTVATVDLAKGSGTDLADSGNGVETYVYIDDNANVTICEVNWYVGDVAGVYAATSTKDAYISVAPRNSTNPGVGSINYTTSDFALDDIVLFTYSESDKSIQDIEKAPTTVSGELTTYVAGSSATVDGTVYKYSKMIATEANSALLSKGVSVDVILDKYGYAIDIDEAGVKNYAVILKIKNSTGTFLDTVTAQLLFTDGTTANVTLTSDSTTYGGNAGGASVLGRLDAGDIVEFSVNSSNKYTLTEKVNAGWTTLTNTELVNNGSSSLNAAFGTGNQLKANGKTIFLVKDSAGNYNTYVGIKNVPTIVTLAANAGMYVTSFVETGNAAATLVYIDANKYANVNTDDVIFVLTDLSEKMSSDSKIGNYYEYKAIVNGIPYDGDTHAKLKVATGSKLTDTKVLFTSASYNSDEVATLGTGKDYVTGTQQEKNGVIGIGTTWYSYADDVKVYYINTDNEVSASTIKGISTDANDWVWFAQNTDGDVSYIFIKEIATGAAGGTVVTAAGLPAVSYDSAGKKIHIPYYGAAPTSTEAKSAIASFLGDTVTSFNLGTMIATTSASGQYDVEFDKFVAVYIDDTLLGYVRINSANNQTDEVTAVASSTLSNVPQGFYGLDSKLAYYATAGTDIVQVTAAETLAVPDGIATGGNDIVYKVYYQIGQTATNLATTNPVKFKAAVTTDGGTINANQAVAANGFVREGVVLTLTAKTTDATYSGFGYFYDDADDNDAALNTIALTTNNTAATYDWTANKSITVAAMIDLYDVRLEGQHLDYLAVGGETDVITAPVKDAKYAPAHKLTANEGAVGAYNVDVTMATYVSTQTSYTVVQADAETTTGIINLVQVTQVIADNADVTSVQIGSSSGAAVTVADTNGVLVKHGTVLFITGKTNNTAMKYKTNATATTSLIPTTAADAAELGITEYTGAVTGEKTTFKYTVPTDQYKMTFSES